MAHKVMIMVGHGTDSAGNWDCGTTLKKNGKTYTEADLMMPITTSAVKYLRRSGVTVLSDADSKNNKNVKTGVAWANKEKVELFISVHCDWSPAPKGVYPLYYSTSAKGKKLAGLLEKEIKNGMKMSSRGITGRKDLAELSQTSMPAVILETGSIDDEFEIFTKKYDEYGKCIAKAVCSYLGVTFVEADEIKVDTTSGTEVNFTTKVPANKVIIRVKPDVNSTKVQDCPSGIFTIIRQSGDWGLLKSKLGWIYLPYTTKQIPTPSTKVVEYLAVVPANTCVIRKSYSETAEQVRVCPAGTFTIVEESSNGWGKLKSNEGWIELSKVTKKPVVKKGKIEQFCEELIREEPIIMSKMKYSNSDGECHTWDDALKYKKCNCAKYISYALQNVDLLPEGTTFYWYHTKQIKPAKALAYFKAHPDEWQITYPNRVMKKSELQVGDICGWHSATSQHTTAICGKDKDGNFIWASGGHTDMEKGMVKVRPNFDKHVVNVHIRYIGKDK